jgi:hypothetical protein
MRVTHQKKIAIVLTSPLEAEDIPQFSPFLFSRPEEIVYCCFFKSKDIRQEFLTWLQRSSIIPDKERSVRLEEDLIAKWYQSKEQEDERNCLLILIQWWMNCQKKPYHVYRMKAEFSPYESSCLLSLSELTEQDLRYNMVLGIEEMEERKREIMGEFGFDDLVI